ncbi:MAG: PLP-dependent transferase, partial [Firmicutes bacterium]|nr:PLP-dependent transferase [Bacillota bacterium]
FRLKNPLWITAFAQNLHIAIIGAGFGGTETIVSLPELHCHAALTPEERTARHISSDVIRVSCGLEETAAVLDAFDHAVQHSMD